MDTPNSDQTPDLSQLAESDWTYLSGSPNDSEGEAPPSEAAPPVSVAESARMLWGRFAAASLFVVVITILAAGITYFRVDGQDQTYAAGTRFAIVAGPEIVNGADLNDSVAALDRPIVTGTATELLQSGLVAEAAMAIAGIDPEELDDYDFAAREVPGAAVISLRVSGPDRENTRALAQAVRDSGPALLDSFMGGFDLRSTDQTEIEAARVGPNPGSDALAMGIAAGIGSMVLLVIAPGIVQRIRREASAVRAASRGR